MVGLICWLNAATSKISLAIVERISFNADWSSFLDFASAPDDV
jgi:hypothetical protein